MHAKIRPRIAAAVVVVVVVVAKVARKLISVAFLGSLSFH